MSWLLEEWALRSYFRSLGADDRVEEIMSELEAEARYWEQVGTKEEDPCEWGAYDCEEVGEDG